MQHPVKQFEGHEMVSRGKRLAPKHEAMLKVLARTRGWEEVLGAGYKVVVMNSLGEVYADKESAQLVDERIDAKTIADAERYVGQLYQLRDQLLEEITANPASDYTDAFSRMFSYFFIVKFIFEDNYDSAIPEERVRIETWRQDDTLFLPLHLYHEKHPEIEVKSGGTWTWIYQGDALTLRDEIISLDDRSVVDHGQLPSVEGRTAFPGVVRGKAHVFMTTAELDTMREGEIIVAPMTTVEFLPIMSKAAAFVTNEGGVTSHAAIVARELKKPCVIATRYATEVFKTGDLIEVDADRGVVTILNKN